MPGGKKSKSEQKKLDNILDFTYNKFKEFEGKKYTGMKVGKSHKWNYDQGVWKETKVTPDEWEITYSVTKRRAGKAPEGSGVPVGTEYHWYILAHQNVCKLDANSYTTALTGIKFKLAHKRANNDKWNISDKAQKRRLIKLLQDMIVRLGGPQQQTLFSNGGANKVKTGSKKQKIKGISMNGHSRKNSAKPVKSKAVA